MAGIDTTVTHITTKELAERWRLSKSALEHWRSKGSGPRFIRFGQGRILYPLVEVEKFEKERTMVASHIHLAE